VAKHPAGIPLSSDVRASFSAGQKIKPYGTETAFFPKTKPKPTDLSQCETVTILPSSNPSQPS